jgi:hypothetical protein
MVATGTPSTETIRSNEPELVTLLLSLLKAGADPNSADPAGAPR